MGGIMQTIILIVYRVKRVNTVLQTVLQLALHVLCIRAREEEEHKLIVKTAVIMNSLRQNHPLVPCAKRVQVTDKVLNYHVRNLPTLFVNAKKDTKWELMETVA
jgi:hypothetical protein